MFAVTLAPGATRRFIHARPQYEAVLGAAFGAVIFGAMIERLTQSHVSTQAGPPAIAASVLTIPELVKP